MNNYIPGLSIVIVNYNSSEYTIRCLDSIQKSEMKTFCLEEIIVVDNASDERNLSILNERTDIRLIRNAKNEGFAKACNQGAADASAEYLLFLNPDTIVKQDTLEVSLSTYRRHLKKGIGALGVQMLDESNQVVRSCSRFPRNFYFFAKCTGLNRIIKSWNLFMCEWNHLTDRKVDEVMGAYFMVSKDIFLKLGGFDERFFVYYEEVDFCYRLVKSGYYNLFCAETDIVHYAGGASKNVKSHRLFYEIRSRIIYMNKTFGHRSAKITIILARLEFFSRLFYLKMKREQQGIKELKEAYLLLMQWLKENSEGDILCSKE